MNRFVQKLIAGAAAVAIVVTGLVGGAPVAKADPTYSITINKQSTDAADHEFNGWQLAELKDVVVNNDKSIAYTIDTNEKLVSTIEAAMDFNAVIDKTGNSQNVLTAYKQDKNYYVSDGNSSNNPMGFLIMHVFSNTGTPNLSSPGTTTPRCAPLPRTSRTRPSLRLLLQPRSPRLRTTKPM